jgi:predicted RecB family endonuclease
LAGAQDGGIPSLLTGAVERVTALTDLLTSLDRKVIETLDAVKEMRVTMDGFQGLSDSSDELVADLRVKIDRIDARLNKDLDDIKVVLIEKLEGLDLTSLGPRFDRLEAAVLNIERATMNLETAMEAGLEAMPDFVSKRVKEQMKQREVQPPPGV